MKIDSDGVEESTGALNFTAVEGYSLTDNNKQLSDLLMKWGLDRTLTVAKFRFSGTFAETSAIVDFINSSSVQQHLHTKPNHVTSATNLQFEPLGTSCVDMSLFDRIKARGLVTESGYIRKMMDETYDGALSCNFITDMFLNIDESENAALFTDQEKDELLFRLLKWVCVGGSLNQVEEKLEPYLLVAKELYKKLVCVVKVDGNISVSSRAYHLMGSSNSNSMCLLIFNETQRSVIYLNSPFVPFF